MCNGDLVSTLLSLYIACENTVVFFARMEKFQERGDELPNSQEIVVLPTLISLDSLDIFGIPELTAQPDTLENIYNKFVAPHRDAGQAAIEPSGTVGKKEQKRRPEAELRQPDIQTPKAPPGQKKGDTASVDAADASSSSKRMPVWEQQPAWRQKSQETTPAKQPKSPASQTSKVSASPKAAGRVALEQSVMARRPRESSLKMRERREAAAGFRAKESGSLSRAGSAAAAQQKVERALTTDSTQDQLDKASGMQKSQMPIVD